ncbi:putative disease resistance protein At1g50180 [Aegilops tauschii subsp. strangulata]
MAEAAVTVVLGNLSNLAIQETTFLCAVTLEVALLRAELVRLQAYLKDADSKWRSGNALVAVLVKQITDVAYEAQNVIEAADYMEKRNRLKRGFMGAISRYARLPSDLATIRKIGVEIQCVRRKLTEIFASADNLKIDLADTVVVVDELPQDFSHMHHNSEDDVVMVGFQNEHNEIVDKLVDSEKMLSAVSIVAMGGAGKTTLARKVYTSSRVKDHFDTVAWVTVSQTFKGIKLLKDIMKQIIYCKEGCREIDEMDEYQVGKKIHDFLLHKRYLVVLDDVWETDTWEQLNTTVNAFPDASNGSRVLLTTRKEDVANHVQMPTHVHPLKKLDEERSWELFSSKALPSYRRSVMEDVDEFEKLGRKLAKKCDGLPLALAVLGGHLSKNLNTQAWSYILLGWPSNKDTQRMRDILARSYKDLSSHYLRSCFLYLAAFPEDFVIIVSDLIQLWIAEGFIHHIPNHKPEQIAHMYVTELAQRSLVQVVDRSKGHRWIERIQLHDILREWCIEEARQDGFLDVKTEITGQVSASSSNTQKFYRSTLQNSGDMFLQTTLDLRTLIGFQLSSIPKMSFLRVLHIENSSLRGASRIIYGCINLRYLRLRRCSDFKLTSSIRKLLYLQTIDLASTWHSSKNLMPKSFWHIPTLRHVYLNNGFPPPKRSVHQNNLETFAVQIRHNNMVKFVSQIKEDPMPILEKLPCLVVLKLEGYQGRTMSCSTQGFPQLRELELHISDNFTEWSMEDGTMPKLSYLKLHDFKRMSRLPEGLLHLPSLKCLKMTRMPLISSGDSTVKELRQKGCQFRVLMSSAASHADAASTSGTADAASAQALAPSSPFMASHPLATAWRQPPASSPIGSSGTGDLPPPIASGGSSSAIASGPSGFRGPAPMYGWYGAPASTFGAAPPSSSAWPPPYGASPVPVYAGSSHPWPYGVQPSSLVHGAAPSVPPGAPAGSGAGSAPAGAYPASPYAGAQLALAPNPETDPMMGCYAPPAQPHADHMAAPSPFYFSHLLPVKLTPDNYLSWRAQVLLLLRSRYLEGYVDGSIPCPPPYHPAYHVWVAQDQAILSAIQSSLTPSVSSLVIFAATSRDAWSALHNSFASQSTARAHAIRTELGETKLDGLSITDRLEMRNSAPHVLNGLDDDYDNLVENIHGREAPLPPRELYARLLGREQRIKARRASLSFISANAATRAKPQKPSPSPGGNPVASSPQARAAPPSITGSARPVACCPCCGAQQACQLCGIERHITSRCHRRYKQDFLSLGNNGKGNEKQAAAVTSYDHGRTPSYSIDPTWYMDTGATNHLTNEMAKLSTKEPYRGHDQVHTANGAGIGRGARLELLDEQPPRGCALTRLHGSRSVGVAPARLGGRCLAGVARAWPGGWAVCRLAWPSCWLFCAGWAGLSWPDVARFGRYGSAGHTCPTPRLSLVPGDSGAGLHADLASPLQSPVPSPALPTQPAAAVLRPRTCSQT